ncbi:hypothetical protein [Flavobacterium sp. 3-210]
MAEQNENLEQNIRLQFDTNANQIQKEVDSLTNSIDGTTEATADSNKETEKSAEKYKSLKAQIREANNELTKAIQLHGETSEQAIKAAQAVAELRDQMEFAADLTANFNPDQKFKALDASAKVAATGINFAAGAIGAFSDDSEEATAVLQKMQSLMAFAEGLKGLSDLGDQFAILKSTIIAATAVREVDTASEKKNILQKGLSAVATTALTAAQWLWNTAMMANPIGLLVAGVAALTGGIWLLVSAMNASEEAEQKQIKTAQDNEKAQKKLTEARKESLKVLERQNDFELELAKASGASAKEVNKLANAHINEASAISQKNAKIASLNFLRERSILLDLKANDASEEAIKAQKEAMKNAYEELQDYNKKTNELKDKRIELNNDFIVSETQKETDLRKKAADDALKAQQDADKKKIEEDKKHAQEALDLKKKNLEELAKAEKDALHAIQDSNAKTELEKLDLRKQRDLEEIEALRQKGLDVTNLMAYNTEMYNTLQAELDAKAKEDALKANEDYFAQQADLAIADAEKQKEIADKKLAQKQAEQDSLNNLANAGLNAAKGLFEKNKGVQKGVIATEGAIALGKVAINTVEAVSKDNAASPLTFGLPWSAVHIATGALGAASIIANTSKALSAVGGGGSAGSAPSMPASPTGGGTRTQATATPQVGFQASSENQIATSIAKNQSEQAPVKAYVVSSEVTTAQSLDRKKVVANSF